MFQEMLASSGGGGGNVKYDTFTMPSNYGSANKVTVDCGFQPKQVMICSGGISTYQKGFCISVNADDTTKNTAGYGNGYWYTGGSSGNFINPNTAVTINSTGFDFELPNSANISNLYSETAYYIAVG